MRKATGLLFLVLLCLGVNGLVLDKAFHITAFSDPFIEVARFGFDVGGSFNFTLTHEWGKVSPESGSPAFMLFVRWGTY